MCGGLFVALVLFGILPAWKKNEEKMHTIEREKVDRKILEEEAKRIPEMRHDREEIERRRDDLHVFLSKDAIISAIEAIESLGVEEGVSVVSEASSAALVQSGKKATKKIALSPEGGEKSETAPRKEEKPEGLAPLFPENRIVPVEFRVTGPYERVVHFVERLDTMPIMLDVLAIQLLPNPDEAKKEASASPSPLPGNIPVVSDNPFVPSRPVREEELDVSTGDSRGARFVRASLSTALYLSSP